MDADLPIPQRVKLLMDQMTLQERARQTYAVHNLPQFTGDFKADLGKTSFGSLKLSGIETDSAKEQVALRNELQAFIVNASRLSIPVSWHNEVLVRDLNDRACGSISLSVPTTSSLLPHKRPTSLCP